MPEIKEVRGESLDETAATITPAPPPNITQEQSDLLTFVVLDKLYYIAGERVSGEVILNVPYGLPQCDLNLISEGREYIKAYDDPSVSSYEDCENTIYKLDCPIIRFDQGLEPGQYVYPFTFKLPVYCPSSFSYEGETVLGEFISASITYKIKTTLRTKRGEVLVKHKQFLNIRSRQAQYKVNSTKEVSESVKNCCLSKGETGLKLEIAIRDPPTVHSTFQFKLWPNNGRWNAPIDHVKSIVSVDMVFQLSNLKSYYVYKELYRCSRATWIAAKTELIYEKDFEYTGTLSYENPNVNPASNNTRFIKWSYRIESFLSYQLSCGAKHNSIDTSIHVNPQYKREKLEPNIPKDWDPVEHPITNLIVDSISQPSVEAKTAMVDSSHPIN